MHTGPILCDDCRLTTAAAVLLAQVLHDLERDRPDDPRWGADLCSSCGEVTGVFDDAEGWVLGNLAHSSDRPAFRAPRIWGGLNPALNATTPVDVGKVDSSRDNLLELGERAGMSPEAEDPKHRFEGTGGSAGPWRLGQKRTLLPADLRILED